MRDMERVLDATYLDSLVNYASDSLIVRRDIAKHNRLIDMVHISFPPCVCREDVIFLFFAVLVCGRELFDRVCVDNFVEL